MLIKEVFKTGFFIVLVLLLSFLIYAVIPRVVYAPTSYGKDLPENRILSKNQQKELSRFVQDTARRIQTAMVLYHGNVIFSEGETQKLINCHSARKSIMSLLIGIARDKGILTLDETLEAIGIDESRTPLTPLEKSANIRNLLRSTSGIFIKSEAEHAWAENIRPDRGEYAPGTYFFYNNFDFNVLGTILEKKSGLSIGRFMEKYLALPLNMQEFSAANVVYNSPWPVSNSTLSDFPVFWIYMSARDFAKIGLLIAQKGNWEGQQIVSSQWLDESLEANTRIKEHADIYEPYDAFSYSWWHDDDTRTMWADGYGGQFLCIDTTNQLVVVQRNFTGNSLISSGLFLFNKDRDNNPKSDLMHLRSRTLTFLNAG